MRVEFHYRIGELMRRRINANHCTDVCPVYIILELLLIHATQYLLRA